MDKQDKVDYGVKLMLRSSMAKVITNTPGYEGYTRVNVSAIMEEQQFQRTGLVSDDEIRKLGQMSGAAYILLTEVAQMGSSLYITASVLNVETAKLENSDNVTSGSKPEEIEASCRKLAAKLFNKAATSERAEVDADLIKDMYLYMKHGKVYNENGKQMTRPELKSYFGGNYHEWEKQHGIRTAGNVMMITGAILMAVGGIGMGMMAYADAKVEEYRSAFEHNGGQESDYVGYKYYQYGLSNSGFLTGVILLPMGGCVLIAGAGMSGSATSKMHKMIDRQKGYRASTQFTFGSQNFGTGFAMKF